MPDRCYRAATALRVATKAVPTTAITNANIMVCLLAV
jgi:hypothetical protein